MRKLASILFCYSLLGCYYNPMVQALLNPSEKSGNKFQNYVLTLAANASPITAPSDLSYPNLRFLNGIQTSFSPSVTGIATNYSISPSLPSGISISGTGIVSGKYSGVFGLKDNYIITASNGKGDVSITTSIYFYGQSPQKTSQTQCYDTSGTLDASCLLSTSIGQDGAHQKGTSVSFTGPTLVGSDYITSDNVSGVIWNSCDQGLTGVTCALGSITQPNWVNAGTACTTTLNNANAGAGYASITNWRLPTPEELESLVNFNLTNPATFTSNFPNTPTGATWHWTSLTDPSNALNAWWVYFTDGQMGPVGTKTTAGQYYARCVSSGSSASSSGKLLVDNGDGTVTDLNKSLVWQKCSMGLNSSSCSGSATTATWANALTYCNGLNLAGYTWRLPNINEAKTILDRRTSIYPAIIDSSLFPATPNLDYWTSSTDLGTPAATNAWVILFNGATVFQNGKGLSKNVRCVASP